MIYVCDFSHTKHKYYLQFAQKEYDENQQLILLGRNKKMAILNNETFVHPAISEGGIGDLHHLYPLSEIPGHITDYQITDLARKSIKDPEVTRTGAHIYQELCSFYDSNNHKIVKEATIAIPNGNLVEEIPYPVVATDPWTTGPDGLNRKKIRQLADMGYPVVWLHHADQRSALQRNKSITRSARQIHALLDDLNGNSDFSVSEVVSDGYSRGGMTGEKFIALAKQHGRTAIFSIFDAPCFATDMSGAEKRATLIKQLPKEAAGIGSIAVRHLLHGLRQGDLTALPEFAKTLNLHPKNVLQEILWAHALINANVGPMIDHQPSDTAGIRNFFEADEMSQLATYINLYAPHKNTVVVAHKGPHVEGASPEYLYGVRQAQFSRLGQAILSGEKLDAELIAQQAELDLLSLPLAS
jgi:hypothetical protein